MNIEPIEVTLIDAMGTDLSVVNAARVSFAAESWFQENGELFTKDAKLINYLSKHKHYSPFNHTFLSFRIKAPIFVARQLVKHEYMPWNEESRRYISGEPSFHPIEFRFAADNVKQGSGGILDPETDLYASKVFWKAVEGSLAAYQELLDMGVAAESARAVLPLNTNTEWIWSGTLKAFHKMLELRLDPHTQKESRDVANLILPLAMQHFPVSLSSLLYPK